MNLSSTGGAASDPSIEPEKRLSSVRTLYISYFGVEQPLVQTQVIPYLRGLAESGAVVHLLTFESGARKTPAETAALAASLASDGIEWHSLTYHKRPTLPATAWDTLAGALFAIRLVRKHRLNFVHARSHVPAVMGLAARNLGGAALVFDIRGFFPEEYVDAGNWPAGGFLFRLAKAVERFLLANAQGFVVLTEKARTILFSGREEVDGKPVEVIPCCVDMRRFEFVNDRAATREALRVSDRNVIVYVGALDGWYLTDEIVRFFAEAHRQDRTNFSLILTQSDASSMRSKLLANGVPEDDFLVLRVGAGDVARHLRAADVALTLIKPCYSKLASSPTKLAEYLAAGLPVISNRGIGDVDELIEREGVGVLLDGFAPSDFRDALDRAWALKRDPGIAARCRDTARRYFDLVTVGTARYARLYQRLLRQRTGTVT